MMPLRIESKNLTILEMYPEIGSPHMTAVIKSKYWVPALLCKVNKVVSCFILVTFMKMYALYYLYGSCDCKTKKEIEQ